MWARKKKKNTAMPSRPLNSGPTRTVDSCCRCWQRDSTELEDLKKQAEKVQKQAEKDLQKLTEQLEAAKLEEAGWDWARTGGVKAKKS